MDDLEKSILRWVTLAQKVGAEYVLIIAPRNIEQMWIEDELWQLGPFPVFGMDKDEVGRHRKKYAGDLLYLLVDILEVAKYGNVDIY